MQNVMFIEGGIKVFAETSMVGMGHRGVVCRMRDARQCFG